MASIVFCEIRFVKDVAQKPSDKVILQKDGTKYTLELKDVDLKQAGIVTVKATNEAGTLSASAKLTVNQLLDVDIALEPEAAQEAPIVAEAQPEAQKEAPGMFWIDFLINKYLLVGLYFNIV